MSSINTESSSSSMKFNDEIKVPPMNNNNDISRSHKSTSRLDKLSYTGDILTFFKQSSEGTSKFTCLLCSIELITSSASPLLTSALTSHLKSKHGIVIDLSKSEKNETIRRQEAANTIKKISRSKNIQDMRNSESSTNMAIHKKHRLKSEHNWSNDKETSHNSRNNGHRTSDLRRNLNLLDFDEPAAIKPRRRESLSLNLFSRLNQLSEPVARKLKFWNKKSFQVNSYDPCFKVIYLGNLGMQYWSKDENSLEKPLNTLWNNYLVNMKTEIVMRLTICNSGLKAITRQHGLTQYWSNRLVYCCSHRNYPKVFCWIYRHEGKKMRQELRCHAVFCSSPERAAKMVTLLSQRLACALQEFRREKKSRGQPSIEKQNSTLIQQTLPRTIPLRRQILAKGSANFRPPLERSKSAPKLMSIREEDYESEDDLEEYEACGDDLSHDEFEYEQSFGERDVEGEEDDEESDYDELGEGQHDETNDDGDSAHRFDSNSLTTTGNEDTSNSSVYATADISYDNIIMKKQHLETNQERLDCASTLTAPAGTTSALPSSSFRRSMSSRKSTRLGRQYQRPVVLSNEKNDDSSSLTNSIDVDLNQFEADDDEDSSTQCEDPTVAVRDNTKTSANAIIQYEPLSSFSSISLRSSIKIDGNQDHTRRQADAQNRQASSETVDLIPNQQQSESDNASPKNQHEPTNTSNEPPNNRHKVVLIEYSTMRASNSTSENEQYLASTDNRKLDDPDDPETRDIILSLSNNLTIG